MRRTRLLLASIAAFSVGSACSLTNSLDELEGAKDGGAADAPTDGAHSPDAPQTDGAACGASGADCQINADCCGQSCQNGRCCAASGATCSLSLDCCFGGCCNGKCSLAGCCAAAGESCATTADCCSGYCSGGTCNDPSCSLGQPCTDSQDCCTVQVCGVNGTCVCGPGFVSCGEVCADLATDPNNCGSCGQDCGSQPCSNGACAP